MVNQIRQFAAENIKEVLLGLFSAIIIAILGNLSLEQGLVLMVLAPLFAVLMKQLLSNVQVLKANQITTLAIIAVVGGFFIMKGFNLGIFSIQNIGTPVQASFSLPIKAISGISGAGIFSVIGGIFFALIRIPAVGIWLAPIFIIGMIVFFGVPFFQLVGAITANFQLILIVLGTISIMFLLFKKQSFAQSKRLALGR